MGIEHLLEPRLQFANGLHVCPRRGITEYGVYDQKRQTRRRNIFVGGVGTSRCLELLAQWIERGRSSIPAPSNAIQENLFYPFCGFDSSSGFGTEISFHSDLSRDLKNSEINEIAKIKNCKDRVLKSIEYYYENIKFLAQNRHVDVIVCVVPEKLYRVISAEKRVGEESLGVEDDNIEELNFRRALKARTMPLGKPLQLIRQSSLESSKASSRQDEATKAWNFFTALYYKSGPTIPWKLKLNKDGISSCAVGISFYRSRDHQMLQTSLAQLFDELGNGLILRGTPIDFNRDDRVPKLSEQQSYELLNAALNEYRIALKTYPARVVIHKSSNFQDEEIKGFESVKDELNIDSLDFVTVMDSKLRLFRNGNYPPFRGTFLQLDEIRQLLYTRGSVWYYQTYPGLYIPQPIELRIVKSEVSQKFIAREILGLTKLNWNTTQFDGKYPVTLGCSRKVGAILKYLKNSDVPQIRYSYYM